MNFRGKVGGRGRLIKKIICLYAQPMDTGNSIVKAGGGGQWKKTHEGDIYNTINNKDIFSKM